MKPESSRQKSSGPIMAGLGAILFITGLLLSVLVNALVTRNGQFTEYGVASYAWLFFCGGLPLTIIGFAVLLVGLIMSFAKK